MKILPWQDQIKTMRTKELSNGRLAMLAFSGMIHHNLVVKGPLFPLFPDNWEGPQGSWEFESVLGLVRQESNPTDLLRIIF